MYYNLEDLKAAFERGEDLKFTFFWGHQPEKNGEIGKGCFSQWFPSNFIVGNEHYATAEHWMMAEKARLFEDEATRQEIITTENPAVAKNLGRKVQHFDAKIWDLHKYEIVKEGNFHKFSQNEAMKRFLLEQGRILVEASPVDNIWGIGMAKNHQDIENPTLWKGENLLGFALMEVRKMLME
jgi:ribA/ribD-fused uncharacterized protein